MSNIQLIAKGASYAINDIGGGTRKVISDLNGSLRSRYFLYDLPESIIHSHTN